MSALVTGANAGIGRAIAEGLLREGRDVVIGARDLGRGLEAVAELERRTGRKPRLVELDLTRGSSIDRAAAGLRPTVLVCNAAAWSTRRLLAPSGHELAWATNVLGHHRLVRQLVAHGTLERIVVVASGLARSLDVSDLAFERRPYRGVDAYAQSKQANRMLTRAYARRWPTVAINSMHPGFTRTGAFSKGGGIEGRVAALGAFLFGQSPARAADTALWLATAPATRHVSGRYFQHRRELACTLSRPEEDDALFELCDREMAHL